MKKLILVASVAIVTLFACQKSEFLTPKNSSENIALSEGLNSNTTSPAFNIELKSSNVVNGSNFEWVWKVTNGSFGKDISHFNFTDFTICEVISLKDALVGAAYSTDGINWTTSTVAWERDPSINGAGRNQDCFGGDVMKIDAGQSTIYYKLILNEEFGVGDNNSNGYWKSSTSCGLISYDGPTCLPEEEKCYDWQTESAWSTGSRYNTKGNWATYSTATALASGVTIYAGKTIDIGTAKLTSGVLTITLKNGWELMSNSSSVKIQGYNTAPSGNPAPGQFTTYKGNSLTPTLSSFSFYGIHLDVRKSFEVPCPELQTTSIY
jgi:hypothetical protein